MAWVCQRHYSTGARHTGSGFPFEAIPTAWEIERDIVEEGGKVHLLDVLLTGVLPLVKVERDSVLALDSRGECL